VAPWQSVASATASANAAVTKAEPAACNTGAQQNTHMQLLVCKLMQLNVAPGDVLLKSNVACCLPKFIAAVLQATLKPRYALPIRLCTAHAHAAVQLPAQQLLAVSCRSLAVYLHACLLL
jgi:hypothetical protein